MTKEQMKSIGELRHGEFFIIEGSETAKKRYIFLPRTLFWKPKYKKFETVWTSFVNKWVDIVEDKKQINEDFKERMEKIKYDIRFMKKKKRTITKQNINKDVNFINVEQNTEEEEDIDIDLE